MAAEPSSGDVSGAAEEEQVANPWEVSAKDGGKIDYDKLIDKFGCQRLEPSIVTRVERLTDLPAHVFLRRGVFFAHRDFNEILDLYERGEKFYLYTGRGPSSESLHLGHLIPFMFTKYLQDAYKVPLVIQLTDDEKCMWKNLPVEECERLARENAKDIIACGFDITRTFIFSDFNYAVPSIRTWSGLQNVSHIIRLWEYLASRVTIILGKLASRLCRRSLHSLVHFHISFLATTMSGA